MTVFVIKDNESGSFRALLLDKKIADKFVKNWNRKADVIDPDAVNILRYSVNEYELNDAKVYEVLKADLQELGR